MLTAQKIAELVNSGLTIALLYLGTVVIVKWTPAVKDVINQNIVDSVKWLILGVYASFLGKVFDSFYWLIPWSLKYLDIEFYEYLMTKGIYLNLIFRLSFGVAASYFHLKSFFAFGRLQLNAHNKANRLLFDALVLGVMTSVTLFLIGLI